MGRKPEASVGSVARLRGGATGVVAGRTILCVAMRSGMRYNAEGVVSPGCEGRWGRIEVGEREGRAGWEGGKGRGLG